ncbi:MAG: hypothetical protein K8F91_06925 [Candidatus Obscuribacterales bacterium]|nr:hypothetical protein [Candidatus Obscuribacterales bacterium]
MNTFIKSLVISTVSAGSIAAVLWYTTNDRQMTICAGGMFWFVIELSLIIKILEKQNSSNNQT